VWGRSSDDDFIDAPSDETQIGRSFWPPTSNARGANVERVSAIEVRRSSRSAMSTEKRLVGATGGVFVENLKKRARVVAPLVVAQSSSGVSFHRGLVARKRDAGGRVREYSASFSARRW